VKSPKRKARSKPKAGEPVAWLHKDKSTAFVITDRVKQIWLEVDAKHVENYTIPLYLSQAVYRVL
jgi:hypothetical protein